MPTVDIPKAEQYLAANARILERRLYERLFNGGPARPVRDAVAAYRTADGGFGFGLEPDGRTPGAQPAAVQMALTVLHQADAWDDELVADACDWLAANAPAQGGATFVLPNVAGWPAGPWWQPEPGLPPSLITTGAIVGALLARGVAHPWVDGAVAACWAALEGDAELRPYDLLGALAFLQEAPDRERAERALTRLAPLMVDPERVAVDPGAEGEVHTPLDYAREPGSVARRFFEDKVIDAHLDHLAGAQQPDGCWTPNWPQWSSAAEREWQGVMTVEALWTLRANGRL